MRMIHDILKWVILLSIFTVSINSYSQTAPDSAYAATNYSEAIKGYSRMIEDSPQGTEEQYYNLGCAYYKSADYGRAILNFERAFRINPTDSDTRFNLKLAHSKAVDKIDSNDSLLTPALNGVTYTLSIKGWMILGLFFFVLGLAGIAIYLLSVSRKYRMVGFYVAIASVVLCVVSNLFAYRSYSISFEEKEAILLSNVVTLKSSPDQSATDIATLHAGLKVSVDQTLNGFSEITLPDGVVGWVPMDSYEKILTDKMQPR